MKKLLVIIFQLFSLYIIAAEKKDTAVYCTINSLPKDGLVLTQGWKFHMGDDPAYARTDYNDAVWQKISPEVNVTRLPITAQYNMGWLRIKLHIAPDLRRTAALLIGQSPALEIYLDGRLIAKRGTIDNRAKTGHGYLDEFDPVQLPLTDAPEQVLAIRFAHQTGLNYLDRKLFLPVFRARFVNTSQLIYKLNEAKFIQLAVLMGIGVLILLAVMHSVLFRYNNKNRGNLYFACYAFSYAIFLINPFTCYFPQSTALVLFVIFVCSPCYIFSALLAIKALYILFKFQVDWFYNVLIGICIAFTLIWIFTDDIFGYTMWGLILLVTVFELWLTIKAAKNKKRGAFIVAGGFFITLIGVFLNVYIQNTPSASLILFVISTLLATLGAPLGISIFLGREFALDSLLLQVKLNQVEELSEKTIRQELEKQALLANQNEVLELQVAERTAALNRSLTDLKATQTQLIQSEKMASLGELTAGIAHEIQNPLNFVINFSEVNKEMITELKDELTSGNVEEALAIANDIAQNEEKINHHGKRADAIVKGMLEHSRASSGTKQPTDINKLADEHLRLAYHGLRAKDKTFNAEMVTHFEPGLPNINVVQQDMGRILLNLFNNAFYAVNQKQKTAGSDYKPEVSVSTSTVNGQVVITVKDNGIGIPDSIKEKIMQPFFTTKPTGEGTGLGLSLTYDMVVKGHGGSIIVNSEEGMGSEFIVKLPFI